MKKFLAVVLGMLFVLGFTASAFAIHAEIPSETQAVVAKGTTQITLGGELRVRGWYLKNYSADRRGGAGTPTDGNSQAWYDQRVRLSLLAEVSKNTSGFVHLETGAATSDVNTWGTLNSKQNGVVTLLEAWILHKGSGLGIPAGVKIGHMPLALGEKQFLDHTKFGDDAVVFFMDPTKELHIGLLTTKFAEGSVAALAGGHSNDINGYVALMTYKSPVGLFGINYTFVDDQTKAVLRNLQNVGIHGNGKVAGLTYKAEVDLQFGKAPTAVVGAPDNKYRGYGILVGLGYNVDPVNIRAEFAQGSGDSNLTDNKVKEYQTTLGNDVHYTFIYEYTTRTAATSGARSTGIANTTYYRLGLDVTPMKDLTASVDVFVLRATKALVGSKKIGTEYDLKLAYKIDRNLTYSITAGMLDPKQWWIDNAGVTSANNKDITQVMHALTLSF